MQVQVLPGCYDSPGQGAPPSPVRFDTTSGLGIGVLGPFLLRPSPLYGILVRHTETRQWWSLARTL